MAHQFIEHFLLCNVQISYYHLNRENFKFDQLIKYIKMSNKDTQDALGKGTNKDYVIERTYSSMIEAKAAIDAGEVADQHWTRGTSYTTNEGDKICFTCKRHPKCPKRMQLLLDPKSEDVLASVSTDDHSHNILPTGRSPFLNPETRAKVLELIESGVTKPKKILTQLELFGLPRISKIQLNNLKRRNNFKTKR